MSKKMTNTTNQGKTRYACFFMAHDAVTYSSIGDPVKVSAIFGYSANDANLFEEELEAAKAFAVAKWGYPADAIWWQMDDENYPESSIECDADEFHIYND